MFKNTNTAGGNFVAARKFLPRIDNIATKWYTVTMSKQMVYKFDNKKLKKQLENIVGLKLSRFFKQVDMFVLVFGDDKEYAFHTFSFLRVVNKGNIIMTSTDEYLLPNHEEMPDKLYNSDEMHEKSLLHLSLNRTLDLLKDAVVKRVSVTKTADVSIYFSNGVVIQSLTDCLWENNEYYRFFEVNAPSEKPHYVVYYSENQIKLKLVYGTFAISREAREKIDNLKFSE